MRKRLFLGALGGALGGLAMKVAVDLVDPNSFGLSSQTDAKTAHLLWRRMGWNSLTEKQATRIGAALHYAFAIGAGAAYAGTAPLFPVVRSGRGAMFGMALWLVGDEVAVSASGLEDPQTTTAFSHLSALGAHLVFGYLVDFTLYPRLRT